MTVSFSKQLIDSVTKTIFYRGMEYFKSEKVFNLKIEGAKVEAEVEGSKQDYLVEMEYDSDGFMGDCDCPYMENNHDDYCKHIVAVAIARDTKLGLQLPSKEELENLTIEEFSNLGKKLNEAYKNPLNADLDAIARATDFGSWVRQHAFINNVSFLDQKDLITPVLVRKAFRKINSLGNKCNYDPYFCAGEITAVSAKTLDVILNKFSNLDNKTQMEIFFETVKFYYQIYLNLIDGSDGVWKIVQARVKKMTTLGNFSSLREKLNKEITGWGDVFIDLQI